MEFTSTRGTNRIRSVKKEKRKVFQVRWPAKAVAAHMSSLTDAAWKRRRRKESSSALQNWRATRPLKEDVKVLQGSQIASRMNNFAKSMLEDEIFLLGTGRKCWLYYWFYWKSTNMFESKIPQWNIICIFWFILIMKISCQENTRSCRVFQLAYSPVQMFPNLWLLDKRVLMTVYVFGLRLLVLKKQKNISSADPEHFVSNCKHNVFPNDFFEH